MNDFTIHFDGGLDDKDRYEMEAKGYRSHVTVSIDRNDYSVIFYDPIRLAQDLEEEGVIAEAGLIVISSVTEEKIFEAVTRVKAEGFFKCVVPK